jgi:hypothetical protein
MIFPSLPASDAYFFCLGRLSDEVRRKKERQPGAPPHFLMKICLLLRTLLVIAGWAGLPDKVLLLRGLGVMRIERMLLNKVCLVPRGARGPRRMTRTPALMSTWAVKKQADHSTTAEGTQMRSSLYSLKPPLPV